MPIQNPQPVHFVAQDARFGQVQQSTPHRLLPVAGMVAVALMTATGCAASTPLKRPNEPLIMGEPTWPEEVTREAARADRRCGAREAQLLYDYQEGKEEQQRFKTTLGSITGAVGTAGGVISGVGAYAINSPDTAKAVSGVTGFVAGGLAAVGSIVTMLVSPGAAKMASSSQSLTSIEEKRASARAVIKKKDPSSWSDEEREAWSKAAKELEAACK
jgi:hypothetical protein